MKKITSKLKNILGKIGAWIKRRRKRHIILAAVLAALVVLMPVLLFVRPTTFGTFVDVCPEYNVPVKSGDTLSSILGGFNVPAVEVIQIDRTLKSDAKIKNLAADKDNFIVFKRDDAPVEKLVLNCGPLKKINIERAGDTGEWRASVLEIVPEIRVVRKEALIGAGDSFYLAGGRAEIPVGVIANVYDLLSFEIDFERDIREGQRFDVLYEEIYAGGEFIGAGEVVFIEIDTLRGKTKMYRFKRPNGTSGYYDFEGKGAIKSLKRTPINNARVTSSFKLKRKHPVLGFTRAHRGTDFRAAHGTPIPAGGSGRVVRRGYDKGYGNFIQIKHNGSFETLYAHMSRFASGVVVGTNVKQGQTIGYVGSTGYSTGPHLHYEIIQNGAKVNPMTVKLPAINNLGGNELAEFKVVRDGIDNNLIELKPGDKKSFIQVQ